MVRVFILLLLVLSSVGCGQPPTYAEAQAAFDAERTELERLGSLEMKLKIELDRGEDRAKRMRYKLQQGGLDGKRMEQAKSDVDAADAGNQELAGELASVRTQIPPQTAKLAKAEKIKDEAYAREH